MTLAEIVAGVILLSLIVYVLLGGADFGGGVWDLLARGPRAERQRELVEKAIGPIWEANHVWVIVAIVLLFTAFPAAFAVIMTALHIPIAILLVGIVLRGSAFVFRKADPKGGGGGAGWQRTFAVSSLVTPVMLGVVAGTVSMPVLGYEDGVVTGGFVDPWLRAFPWAVGLFTLALVAFLAAVYLTLETGDPDLRNDFRRRALGSAAVVAALGIGVASMTPGAAPDVAEHLASARGGAVVAGAAAALAGAVLALLLRRYAVARLLAPAVAVGVLVGWGVGLHPWLVVGAVRIDQAAAPDATLRIVTWILAGGGVILVPAYVYLYRTFKGRVLFPRPGG